MAPSDNAPWTPRDSSRLYGLEEWGGGYFGVSEEGTVEVYPGAEPSRGLG